MHQFNHIIIITCNVDNTCSRIYFLSRDSIKLTIGNVIFSNYNSSVCIRTELRVSTLVLFIIIISMNKSQELTVFHGRQKLTSAKN